MYLKNIRRKKLLWLCLTLGVLVVLHISGIWPKKFLPFDSVIVLNETETRLRQKALTLDKDLAQDMVHIPDLPPVSCDVLLKQPSQLLIPYPNRIPGTEHSGQFIQIFDTPDTAADVHAFYLSKLPHWENFSFQVYPELLSGMSPILPLACTPQTHTKWAPFSVLYVTFSVKELSTSSTTHQIEVSFYPEVKDE